MATISDISDEAAILIMIARRKDQILNMPVVFFFVNFICAPFALYLCLFLLKKCFKQKKP